MITRAADKPTLPPDEIEGATVNLRYSKNVLDRTRNLQSIISSASWGLEQGFHDLRVAVTDLGVRRADTRLQEALTEAKATLVRVANSLAGEGSGSAIYPQSVLNLLNAIAVWVRDYKVAQGGTALLRNDRGLIAAFQAYERDLIVFNEEGEKVACYRPWKRSLDLP